MNEQVLRSIVALAVKDLYSNSEYEKVVKSEKSNGFYLTAFTTEQLEYYRKNRDKFKTFKEFAPYLLEQYHNNQDMLLKLVQN